MIFTPMAHTLVTHSARNIILICPPPIQTCADDERIERESPAISLAQSLTVKSNFSTFLIKNDHNPKLGLDCHLYNHSIPSPDWLS